MVEFICKTKSLFQLTYTHTKKLKDSLKKESFFHQKVPKNLTKKTFLSIINYTNYIITKKMTQKEYLIKILEQLEPVWSLARWLKILVNGWHLDNNLLETITEAIQWAIHTAKTDQDKKKLQKWLDALQRMRQMEEEARKKEQKDLEELDKMLEEI